MSNCIKIVITDDHPILRRGLRDVIEEDKRLIVVAEAGNGKEAIEAIEKHSPDVTILDVDMPVMNGFQAAAAIRERKFSTEVVFLTIHQDEDLFNEAIDLGAKGFVLKENALTDIIACINAVAVKKYYVSQVLTSFLINRSQRVSGGIEKRRIISDLTPTERRVLKLIAENMTSKEIGEQLFVSPRTVEKHRSNICQKLNLQGSHSLFKFAIQHKSEID